MRDVSTGYFRLAIRRFTELAEYEKGTRTFQREKLQLLHWPIAPATLAVDGPGLGKIASEGNGGV